MGTELQRRGFLTTLPEWSARALFSSPDLVRTIHEEYIRAGAQVITTNTFRTTRRALSKAEMGGRARELCQLAVELAKDARLNVSDGKQVLIAGSIAPLEDCYQPDAVPDEESACVEHEELASWLVEGGVDLILVETMNTIAEARAALRAAKNVSALPVWVSFVCAADGRVLSGERIVDAVEALAPFEPAAHLINCTNPKATTVALGKLIYNSRVPVGAYANMGHPEPTLGWEFRDELRPDEYAQCAQEWILMGATIIGGCCGTTPRHIEALRQLKGSNSSSLNGNRSTRG